MMKITAIPCILLSRIKECICYKNVKIVVDILRKIKYDIVEINVDKFHAAYKIV